MVTDELINYIKTELTKGRSKEEINQSLFKEGWNQEDLNEVYSFLSNSELKKEITDNKTQTGQTQFKTEINPQLNIDEQKQTEIINQSETQSKVEYNQNNIVQNVEQKEEKVSLGVFTILKESINLYKSKFLYLFLSFILSYFFLFLAIFFALKRSLFSLEIADIILFGFSFIFCSILFIFFDILFFYVLASRNSLSNIKNVYKEIIKSMGNFFKLYLLKVFIILGASLFFIIPGIIYFISFSFAFFIFFQEGIKGREALIKSREYIKGYWWKVFGHSIFIVLFVNIFSILINTILNVSFKSLNIDYVFYLPLGDMGPLNLSLSLIIGSSIFGVLLSSFMFIYLFNLYKKIKLIKGEIVIENLKRKKRFMASICFLSIFLLFVLPLLISIIFSALSEAKKKAEEMTQNIENIEIREEESINQDLVNIINDTEEINEKSVLENNDIVFNNSNEENNSFSSWQEYTFKDNNFSVKFPNQPTIQKEEDENAKAFTYVSLLENESIAYSVSYLSLDLSNEKEIKTKQQKEELTLFVLNFSYMQLMGEDFSLKEGNKVGNYRTFDLFHKGKFFGKAFLKETIYYTVQGFCNSCLQVPNLDNFISSFKLLVN